MRLRLRASTSAYEATGASGGARQFRQLVGLSGTGLGLLPFLLIAFTASSAAAAQAGATHESSGVREVLARRLQVPGPSVVSVGGSGGLAGAPAPSGQLVPSLSTAFSDTWSAPEKRS